VPRYIRQNPGAQGSPPQSAATPIATRPSIRFARRWPGLELLEGDSAGSPCSRNASAGRGQPRDLRAQPWNSGHHRAPSPVCGSGKGGGRRARNNSSGGPRVKSPPARDRPHIAKADAGSCPHSEQAGAGSDSRTSRREVVGGPPRAQSRYSVHGSSVALAWRKRAVPRCRGTSLRGKGKGKGKPSLSRSGDWSRCKIRRRLDSRD